MNDRKIIENLIEKAIAGDGQALESILLEVQDLIFNLSLRMLGSIPDAEDATQDILVRVMTNLASFRKESHFKTWVYRLATNYLCDYKKSMFAQHPLDFDFYGQDIQAGFLDGSEDLFMGVGKDALSQELKMSCTNVMLQCFDPITRCVFILGTMFKIDSRIAGEILGMTPENYRQKLSRARKKMAGFLASYCGLAGSGLCSCEKRVGYAVSQHRINPEKLEFQALKKLDDNVLSDCKEAMEQIDEYSLLFEELPHYHSSLSVKDFMRRLLQSKQIEKIQYYQEGSI